MWREQRNRKYFVQRGRSIASQLELAIHLGEMKRGPVPFSRFASLHFSAACKEFCAPIKHASESERECKKSFKSIRNARGKMHSRFRVRASNLVPIPTFSLQIMSLGEIKELLQILQRHPQEPKKTLLLDKLGEERLRKIF